ncbi:hypothetical protein CRU92_08670 [Arcobacter sp. FW59]|nr:hypothetical protein CRU92_08670 [Arcobacter sp. FW59]
MENKEELLKLEIEKLKLENENLKLKNTNLTVFPVYENKVIKSNSYSYTEEVETSSDGLNNHQIALILIPIIGFIVVSYLIFTS